MYKETAFCSQAVAQNYHEPAGKNTRIIISITSPPEGFNWGSHPAVLHEDTWLDVLRLEFDDVDPSHMNAIQASMFRIFNEEDANRILDFLEKYQGVVERAIVHCEAGISRSAAVAKFISYTSNLAFPADYNVYNKHVYLTLMRVYGARTKNVNGS